LRLEQEYNSRTIADIGATEERMPFALVIGKIFGGYYETVTAAETIVRGGAYFAPQLADLHEVMQRFRRCLAEVNAADPFFRVHPARLEFLHHDDATLQPPRIAVAAAMCKNLTQHGRPAQVMPGPFACDMRHLVNQSGVPSIIFGPGSIAQAHKPDENIAVQEYLQCIEYLIEFICSWCNIETDNAAIAGAGD
jgi:acetylornithine deacetylase